GLLSDAGIRMPREPTHVHLVNDGARGGPPEGRIPLPVVSARFDDDAFHRGRGVVAFPPRSVAAVGLRNDDTVAVRVEEELRGIKPESALRNRWPFYPVSVNLPRHHTRHKHVPIVVRTVRGRVDPNHT